jgi:hypothetical protein
MSDYRKNMISYVNTSNIKKWNNTCFLHRNVIFYICT